MSAPESQSDTSKAVGRLSEQEGQVSMRMGRAAVDHLAAWEADRRYLAIHEGAGHGGVAILLGVPIELIAIDHAGGVGLTIGYPLDTETAFETAARKRDRIAATMGGLAAETVFFGEHTDGGHGDLSSALYMATRLMQQGLDAEGPIYAAEWSHSGMLSERLRMRITDRAEAIVREQWDRATDLVRSHSDSLLALASHVYEQRRLSGRQLDEAVAAAGLPPRGSQEPSRT